MNLLRTLRTRFGLPKDLCLHRTQHIFHLFFYFILIPISTHKAHCIT